MFALAVHAGTVIHGHLVLRSEVVPNGPPAGDKTLPVGRKLMRNFPFFELCLVFFLGAASVVTLAQEADAKPDTEIVAEQYLLVGSPTRGAGSRRLQSIL